jgi:F-box protein 11
MSCLDDLPELVGFFSYSREDDDGSQGALSALRESIQQELRAQLGRSTKTFRLWQDKEAIASGKLWEAEIKTAVWQSVFFMPIITPTVVKSPYCKFELDAFLAREAELGRDDLVFPILYIKVPALEDSARQKSDPVLSIIAKRQYVDWRELRHSEVHSKIVKEAVERFCSHVCEALWREWLTPEERKALSRFCRCESSTESSKDFISAETMFA